MYHILFFYQLPNSTQELSCSCYYDFNSESAFDDAVNEFYKLKPNCVYTDYLIGGE
jgi:hypothetical protein